MRYRETLMVPTPPDRIDLVVSHNQEASDAALRIVEMVEAQGFFAWADGKAFYSPLMAAEKQIARAFARARVICLFVGDKYRDTRWCQEEYSLGLRAEKDLSIDRVISVHHGASGRSLIPSSLANRPAFPFTDIGLQGVVKFLSTLPDHSAALAQWTRNGTQSRSDLLGRLPVAERTKLVVEHVEYLVEHFVKGTFEQGSERHALQLGLIGSQTSKTPVHLSPASLMEFAWRWALEILGEYNVQSVVGSAARTENPRVDIEAILPFLRLPALFHRYLAVARERRDPPTNTETELFSVVDHLLCGFSVLCVRAGVEEEVAFREAAQLLSLFSASEPGVSRTAAYLRDHLPTVAYPENSTLRRMSIYRLLRTS